MGCIIVWHPHKAGVGSSLTLMGQLGATPCQQQQGIIRDSDGRCVGEYSRKIGHTTCAAAELWGLRDTRQIALDKGFRNIEIEFDAKAVIQLIHNTIEPIHHLRSLILDCRLLMRELGLPALMHTFREGNSCADL